MKYFLLLTLLLQISLNAKEPKLKLGLGTAAIEYPDYIGSNSYRTLALPFPYIKYESDYLSIDKNGINTELFNIKNLTLDLSVGGSLPANSKDNKVRDGMPDLNFTFEVGPKLSYRFYKNKILKIYFDLATRLVFETDLKMLDTQGIVATSELKFELEFDKLEITLRSGLRFATQRYHNYFYGVDKEYEISTREAYNAKAGYSGYKNRVGLTYRSGDWWYGAFGSYHLLNGAIYEDSPLVETNSAVFTGLSIAYIFYVD